MIQVCLAALLLLAASDHAAKAATLVPISPNYPNLFSTRAPWPGKASATTRITVDIPAIGAATGLHFAGGLGAFSKLPAAQRLTLIAAAVASEVKTQAAAAPAGANLMLQLEYHNCGLGNLTLPGSTQGAADWDQKLTAIDVVKDPALAGLNITGVSLTSCHSWQQFGVVDAVRKSLPKVEYVQTISQTVYLSPGQMGAGDDGVDSAGNIYVWAPDPANPKNWIEYKGTDGDGIKVEDSQTFDIMKNTAVNRKTFVAVFATPPTGATYFVSAAGDPGNPGTVGSWEIGPGATVNLIGNDAGDLQPGESASVAFNGLTIQQGGVLVLDPDATLGSQPPTTVSFLELLNDGKINLNGNVTFNNDGSATAGLGTAITVAPGITLTLGSGAFLLTGDVVGGGTVVLAHDASLTAQGQFTTEANWLLQGVLDLPSGTCWFNGGSIGFAAGATWNDHVSNSSDAGLIETFSGTVNLRGVFDLQPASGFTPAPGTTYRPLSESGGRQTGKFKSVLLGGHSGLLTPAYTSSSFKVTVAPPKE